MIGRSVVKSQLAKLADVGLAFLITILLSRWMGPQGFGSYSLIIGLISLGGLIISLGFSEILTRHVPALPTGSARIPSLFIALFAIRLGMIGLVSITLLFLRPSVLSWPGHDQLLAHADLILTLFLFVQICDLSWSFYVAQLRIETVLLSHTVRQTMLIGMLFLLSGRLALSLKTVLTLVCIAYVFSILVYAVAFRKAYLVGREKWTWSQLLPLLKFGLSAWGIAAVTFLLSEQTDVLLLGYFVRDAREVAFYKVGTAPVWKLIGVITVGSQVTLASLSTLFRRGGEEGLARGWRTFLKISAISVVPVYLFFGRYAPQIVSVLYGPDYGRSALILRVFVGITIIPFGLLGGGLHLMTLYTVGREREGLVLRFISGMVNIALAIFLIREYRALGAVIATGVAALVGISLEYVVLQRFAPQAYPWAFFRKMVASAIAGWIVLLPFSPLTWYGLLGIAIPYVMVIVSLLAWWKPISHEEHAMIGGISPRLATALSWWSAAA
jgi:O-antigen/teichoic acid export membrane protein